MNLVFAFILLATLYMVNAIPPQQLLKKTSTTFVSCPVFEGAPPPTLTVTLSPDPIVAGTADVFTVSGTLNYDITASDELVISFSDPLANTVINTTAVALCDGSNCPIKAGIPFTQTVQVSVPAKLPSPYAAIVAVVDPVSNGMIGCAVAFVWL
nr:7747_t:CDS:1 [Entrophospora candida]CAG8556662.1 5659_t:CDS:1 [Entrophospora candida]